jgi:hypothetical protein
MFGSAVERMNGAAPSDVRARFAMVKSYFKAHPTCEACGAERSRHFVSDPATGRKAAIGEACYRKYYPDEWARTSPRATPRADRLGRAMSAPRG